MTVIGRIGALVVLLAVLTGCASASSDAMVMCEQFVNDRIGRTVKHDGPLEGASVKGDGPFVVRSAFTEPTTGRRTSYVCTVAQVGGDRWRLVDLATDR